MRGYKTIWVNNDSKGKTYKIELSKNQKLIKIHRIKNGINFKANEEAQESLSQNAFSLYIYLIRHEEDRIWALSSKAAYPKTHLTESTYRKAVQELISKNYLTHGTISLGNGEIYKEDAYHLWETPSLIKEATPVGNETFKFDEPTLKNEVG